MRIVKIEKRVYKYSELQVHAKDAVRNYILSVVHDSDTFSEAIKESIESLGFKDVELHYSLGNCQGDGLCFTGSINWIDLNRIAEIHNKIDQLNAEFVISCNDCLDNIKFTRLSHMYCHSRTVSVDIDNTNWMDVQDYIVFKDIILNWYNSLCNRYEKEGYKWFEEINEQDVIDYCDSNGLEFFDDGTIFVESA